MDNSENLKYFVIEWMKGASITKLNKLWGNFFSETDLKDEMNRYINKFLQYRYPWGFTVFLMVLIYSLNKNFEKMPKNLQELPSKIRELPVFIKYGLNNPSACMARSVGINTRETSLKIAKLFKGNDFKDFVEWFAELDIKDVLSLKISKFETDNIFNLIQDLSINFNTFSDIQSSKFDVKGIYYSGESRRISKKLKIGDILTLKRDFDNKYDVYAIKIMYKAHRLGFVPKKLARIIAVEMDLNNIDLEVEVIKIQKNESHYNITVKLI